MSDKRRQDDELREALAAYAHEAWAHWMRYLFSKCINGPADSKTPIGGTRPQVIPVASVERWQRQMDTPYAELSEAEKESDREQADKILKVLNYIREDPSDINVMQNLPPYLLENAPPTFKCSVCGRKSWASISVRGAVVPCSMEQPGGSVCEGYMKKVG